jgi:hypothetical protein
MGLEGQQAQAAPGRRRGQLRLDEPLLNQFQVGRVAAGRPGVAGVGGQDRALTLGRQRGAALELASPLR